MNAKTSFKLTPIPNSESVRHNGEFAGVVRRDLRYIAHAFMLVKWTLRPSDGRFPVERYEVRHREILNTLVL